MSATHDAETTPLLREDDRGGGGESHEVTIEPVRPANVKATLTVLIVLIVIAMFSNFMSIPAQNVIFEGVICDNYFAALNETGGLPYPPVEGTPNTGDPCKSEPVQSELGYIMGWKDTFEVLPTIVVGVPLGMLGDRIGRRPIMFNALLWTSMAEFAARIICYWSDIFPLRAVWYANLIMLLGGGAPVASSMIFTVIADITSPDKRADLYVVLMGILLVTETLATTLGAAIADTGHPWIAYLMGPFGIFFASFCVFALPETRPHQSTPEPPTKSAWSKGRAQQFFASLAPRSWPRQAGKGTLRAARALWDNLSLVCLVVVFFISLVRRQAQNFLVLYASKKFGWSLSRASYLSGLRSAVNLVLLLLIIPAVSHWLLQARGVSAARKDLLLLRVQAGLITLGAVLVGVAPHPAQLVVGVVVFGLGAAFDVNARSLATSLVQRTHFATLNTALALSESLGLMCSGPVMASAWHSGLVLGGAYLGLPFALAAIVFAAALAVTAVIRVADAEAEGELQERESLLEQERERDSLLGEEGAA